MTTILLLFMMTLVQCDGSDPEETSLGVCITEGISINENAKYFQGELWQWYMHEGNLEILAYKDGCNENNFGRKITFDITKECPGIIESFYVSECPCDSDYDFVCADTNFTYYDDTGLKIQKWISGEVIIGTHAGTNFWVELSENNKRYPTD